MILRFAGSCLIGAAGAIWGLYRSSLYKQRMDMCRCILDMIRKTETMIRYEGCDVYEIVRELSSCADYSEMGLICVSETDGEFSTSACCDVEKLTNSEEKKLISRFWSEIGTTDSEGQVRILEGLYEAASQLMGKRESEYAKYGKLYRSVGVLLGLMAGVAVI